MYLGRLPDKNVNTRTKVLEYYKNVYSCERKRLVVTGNLHSNPWITIHLA